MKRTKENWLHGHPQDRNGISGLRQFDGEDLHYQERQLALKSTQRDWIEEQKREKEQRRQEELNEEMMYAQQTEQINRMRGVLEEDLKRKQRTMQEATRDANLQLLREKKERERQERESKLKEEQEDLMEQTRIRQVPNYINPLN